LFFCAAALHHSSDLPLLLRNISRVLKPGGRLCAINEPCIAISDNEQRVLESDAAAELQLGINETRPNFIQYVCALRENGLQLEHAFAPATYHLNAAALLEAARQIDLSWQWATWRPLRRSVRQLRSHVQSRWRAWRNSYFPLKHTGLALPDDPHQRLLYDFLLWTSGEIFLLARK
jgi:SAM-dependent methyltransferase